MNHKVNNVGKLHEDATTLYSKTVSVGADGIIADLGDAITTLKNSWGGKDACVQINNVIEIYNAMVELRNALSGLARDSVKVAVGYRDIQISNKALLGELNNISTEDKTKIELHSDERDTVDITPEAVNGKNKLESVRDRFDSFANEVRTKYDEIMENWQAGAGRDNAKAAFEDFMNKESNYKQVLADVSGSIATAVKNYEL